MKITVKQLIPQGFCLKCRGCCRFSQQNSIWQPHLLKEEKPALGEIQVVADPEGGNFICGNLSLADNKCKIYAKCPFECRLYPFLFARKKSRIFLALDLNCTFVRENNKAVQESEYAVSLIKLVQGGEYLEILRDNPHLAQEYEGVLDLIELKV